MIQGKIENIAFGGNGILRHEGLVIFVPYAAPGDYLKIELHKQKSSHAFGTIVEIEESGPERVPPRCPLFGKCGGCQFQHLSYETQLEIKRRFVEESLQRIGKITWNVPPVVPAFQTWHYRAHIRLNLRPKDNGFMAGYIDPTNLALVKPSTCAIFTEEENAIFRQLQSFLLTLDNRGIPEASLRLFKVDNRFLLGFSFSPKLPENRALAAAEALKTYPEWAGILMRAPGQKDEFGVTKSTIEIEGLQFHYSPYGFLQNHPEQSKKLYKHLLEILSPNAHKVFDLYCGIGISTLLLGKQGKKVIGIELHGESIKLAKQNALINRLDGVQFIQDKAEKATGYFLKTFKPDAIILNPPREGLSASLIQQLLLAPPPELLYISCMPSTLARDLKLLTESHYQIVNIQPFDMFPQTTHVETCVKLILTQSNPYSPLVAKRD